MSNKISILTLLFVLLCVPAALAQSGPLTGTPALLTPSGRPMRMTEASLTFQAPPKQHVFEVDDIIYVRINEQTSYSNTANNQRKKKIETDARLTYWTKFAGLFKMPLSITGGTLPAIGGELDHQTQNQGRLVREEKLDFELACRITDIRDNGNLVIEGNRSFGIGEEGNIITVTGIVRPHTIGQDFKVESKHVTDLVIRNVPSGNVYDTVRRPWGARLIEQLKPF